MSNGGGHGWRRDPETGEKTIMPEKWDAFLDWLVTFPRDPEHQYQWAEQNGIHEDSLRRIKRDPRFVAEWEKRAATTNASVERVNNVVAALYEQAQKGDVKAASLYLQYVEKFTPKRRVETTETVARSMSDEELAKALAG